MCPAADVEMVKSRVALARCGSYEPAALRAAIDNVLEPLGGIGSFVKPGMNVLIKPNLLSAKGPERAITTHPNLVEAVAQAVRGAGGNPKIGDSPGGAIRGINRVWVNTGMREMADRAGLELVNFESSGSAPVRSGKFIFHIAKPVLETDLVISLAKLKTHTLTLMTCGVKNMFGAIPGFSKAELHKAYPKPDEFSAMLVELYRTLAPPLTIVDAVLAMEGNGPSSGRPRHLGFLMSGVDAVAIDAVAADILGFGPEDVATVRIGDRTGAGTGNLSGIEVCGCDDGMRPEDFELPSNKGLRLIPRPLARLIAPMVWLKLYMDETKCTHCRLCVESCPVKAITDDGAVRVDHKKCIQCMCCHELCPESAVEIRMSLLARLFI